MWEYDGTAWWCLDPERERIPITDYEYTEAKMKDTISTYTKSSQAKTNVEEFDLTQIPYSSLIRLGKVFQEGDTKYSNRVYSDDKSKVILGNWYKGIGNKEYQLERANHALKHLLIYIHELETGEYVGKLSTKVETKNISHTTSDTGECIEEVLEKEDDLAKVMWFCATQIELERLQSLKLSVRSAT